MENQQPRSKPAKRPIQEAEHHDKADERRVVRPRYTGPKDTKEHQSPDGAAEQPLKLRNADQKRHEFKVTLEQPLEYKPYISRKSRLPRMPKATAGGGRQAQVEHSRAVEGRGEQLTSSRSIGLETGGVVEVRQDNTGEQGGASSDKGEESGSIFRPSIPDSGQLPVPGAFTESLVPTTSAASPTPGPQGGSSVSLGPQSNRASYRDFWDILEPSLQPRRPPRRYSYTKK